MGSIGAEFASKRSSNFFLQIWQRNCFLFLLTIIQKSPRELSVNGYSYKVKIKEETGRGARW